MKIKIKKMIKKIIKTKINKNKILIMINKMMKNFSMTKINNNKSIFFYKK